jgi:hypothetical protein
MIGFKRQHPRSLVMSWTYGCPHCNSVVNPDETVILVAVHDNMRFLIGFHPAPGNYTIYLPPGIQLDHGSQFRFLCPICQRDLQSAGHNNLSCLDVWQGDTRRKILFSNIAGEHATYVVKEDDVLIDRHGPHSDAYDEELKR